MFKYDIKTFVSEFMELRLCTVQTAYREVIQYKNKIFLRNKVEG